jgi:CRP/FNR family transcriptional regulator, cyclic AMP receptor protein
MGDERVHFGLFEGVDDVVALGPGDTVFCEGDAGDGRLFVIRSGAVAIRVRDATVEVLRPGELFGEMAIVDDGPRSATAVAEEPTVLVPIDRRQFRALVASTPFFAENVMRVMARRLRKANSLLA